MSTVFENEVVTRALVRYLSLPGLSGEFALITIDNGHDHTRPSTFGPGGLASLDAALDDIAAHSPAPVAIGVTGKPFIFAVGADLSDVPSVTELTPTEPLLVQYDVELNVMSCSATLPRRKSLTPPRVVSRPSSAATEPRRRSRSTSTTGPSATLASDIARLAEMNDLPAAGVAEVTPIRRGLWPSRTLAEAIGSIGC